LLRDQVVECFEHDLIHRGCGALFAGTFGSNPEIPCSAAAVRKAPHVRRGESRRTARLDHPEGSSTIQVEGHTRNFSPDLKRSAAEWHYLCGELPYSETYMRSSLTILLLIVFACVSAPTPLAAYTSANSYFGDDVTMPVITHKVEPNYSEKARKAKYSGTVLLSALIDIKGRPQQIKVVRPLGLGLDEQAVKAVSKWRFKPGTKNGHPAPTSVQIEVSFRLL